MADSEAIARDFTPFVTETTPYVPELETTIQDRNLYDLIASNPIRNQMVREEGGLKSIYSILTDILSDNDRWVNAIRKQEVFAVRNLDHMSMHLTNSVRSVVQQSAESSGLIDFDGNARNMFTMHYMLEEVTLHKRSVRAFKLNNAHLFARLGKGLTFDIFLIKLPAKVPNDDGVGMREKWVNLYEVFDYYMPNDVPDPPVVMNRETDILDKLTLVFGQRLIGANTYTNNVSPSTSFGSVVRKLRTDIHFHKTGTENAYVLGGHFRRYRHRRNLYGAYTKKRYTLGMIMRWLELIHTYVFRGQVAHSITHEFYRNIQAVVYVRRPPQIYINAKVRTIEEDNMPDEELDPILYEPYEIGSKVFKMNCCGKDLAFDGIVAMIQSGRRLQCPMCRTSLITTDTQNGTMNPLAEPEVPDPPYQHPFEYLRSPILS